MLTDEECAEAVSILSEYMVEAGLQWVVDQFDETIALGKLVDVPIRERGFASAATYEVLSVTAGAGRAGRGTARKTIPQVQDYTDRERLTMFLDALERAVVRAGDLERSALNLLASDRPGLTVEFVAERRGGRGFFLDASEEDRLAAPRKTLSDRIGLLRREIDAS